MRDERKQQSRIHRARVTGEVQSHAINVKQIFCENKLYFKLTKYEEDEKEYEDKWTLYLQTMFSHRIHDNADTNESIERKVKWWLDHTFCGMGQTQISRRTNLSIYIIKDALNSVFKLILLQ